ncbi:MAG TPA: hypothetical protein VLH86_06355 [Patescibacteria group bacterium]|nr:hypothetical protein [Patescibacteria group bacterium]
MSTVEQIANTVSQTAAELPVGELRAVAAQITEAAGLVDAASAGNSPALEDVSATLLAAASRAEAGVTALTEARTHLGDYLGAIGAGHFLITPASAPSSATETRGAAEVPLRDGELIPDTALTRDQLLTDLAKWQAGEAVQSGGTHIATLELTDREREVLAGISVPYTYLTAEDLSDSPQGGGSERRHRFTEEQLAVIRRIHRAFLDVVNKDGERGGLGRLDPNFSFLVQAGMFEPDDHDLGWHVDAYGRPGVRYVASFGDAGSTNFGAGELHRGQVTAHGDFDENIAVAPGEPIQPQNHGVGAVSRFHANTGLHNTPHTPGFRLFMSASIVPKNV